MNSVKPTRSLLSPVGNELCFITEGSLDVIEQEMFSKHLKECQTTVRKHKSSLRKVVKTYSDTFRDWCPGEITTQSLFGFPTIHGKFSLEVSSCISDIFGDFLNTLEKNFSRLNIRTGVKTKYLDPSGFTHMKGKYALVLYPGFDTTKGEYVSICF